MKKHIFNKISVVNTENLSSHNFTNYYTLNDNDKLEITNDLNSDVLEDSEIEGVKYCREEENKISSNNLRKSTKVDQLPVFPNLSE